MESLKTNNIENFFYKNTCTTYYPFGMKINSLSYDLNASNSNKYLMQGKELQDDFGYNVYDFEARHYDPALARTTTIDPHAENYLDFSGYSFLGNNPMVMVDPTGMDWFYNENSGDVQYISNLHKGAEEHMEKGWTHMGENGMFDESSEGKDVDKSDFGVIKGNEGLASNVDFSFNKNGTMSGSASFKGENAEKFMGKQDYKFAPKNIEVINSEQSIDFKIGKGKSSITYGEKTTHALTGTYVKKDFVVTRSSNFKYIDYNTEKNPLFIMRGIKRTNEKYSETLHYGAKGFSYYLGKFITGFSSLKGKHNMQNQKQINSWER